MNTPAISVVVVAYNIEKDLPRCLDSILTQDFTDLELILVDDGSTDGTAALCDSRAARDHRVRVLHKSTNTGAGEARNTGFCAACGQYVSFIDGDDRLLPGAYTRLWELVRMHHPDIVRYGFRQITPGREPELWLLPYEEGLYQSPRLRALQLDAISYDKILDYRRRRIASVWSCLYRRELLEGLRFRSERDILNEDYLYQLQAMWAARSVYVLPEGLYEYHCRRGSLSHTPRREMYPRKKKLFDAYRQFLPADDTVRQRLNNFYIDAMYNCITEACRTMDRRDALAEIRRVLQDERLGLCLRENAACGAGRRSRCICLLMRLKLAWPIYRLYRLFKKQE